MAFTLLQIDFPHQGPWGSAMSQQLAGLAQEIAFQRNLLWKIWTENKELGLAGGIYLFSDEQSAVEYQEMHTQRLAAIGVGPVRAIVFAVNDPLTYTTRGPVD